MSLVGEALARMLGGAGEKATNASASAAVSETPFERWLSDASRRERARKASSAESTGPEVPAASVVTVQAPAPEDATAPPAEPAASSLATERSGDPDVPDAPAAGATAAGAVTRAATDAPRVEESAPLPTLSWATASDAIPLDPAPLARTTMPAPPATDESATSMTPIRSVTDGAMLGAQESRPDTSWNLEGALPEERSYREPSGVPRGAHVDERDVSVAAPRTTVAARDPVPAGALVVPSPSADGAPEQGIANRAPDAADRVERPSERSDGERSDGGRSTPRHAPTGAAPAPDAGAVAEHTGDSAARAMEPLAAPQATRVPAVPERGFPPGDAALPHPTLDAAPRPALTEDPALLGVLSRHVADAAGAGRRELLVRLTPPHLGHVRVRFTFDDEGRAHARLSVSDPTVHRLLDKNLSDLRVALREHGVDLRDLDLMGRGFDAEDPRERRGASDPALEARAAFSEPIREVHEDTEAARSLRRPAVGLIDISA